MAPSKKKTLTSQTGGCNCVGSMPQSGGSLASLAVVDLVPEHAWASLDEHATNAFVDSHIQVGGNHTNSTLDPLAPGTGIMRALVSHITKPISGGSAESLDSLLTANLAGPLKKKYTSVMKKYSSSKKLKGGSSSSDPLIDTVTPSEQALLENVESLTSYLSPNFTSVVSKMLIGGGGKSKKSKFTEKSFEEMANPALDNLTLHGAKRLGELLHDPKMFKSGVSIASYMGRAADFVPSKQSKTMAKKIAAQHGGKALDLISALSAANLDKVSALVGGTSALSAIFSYLDSSTLQKKPSLSKKKAPRA